MCVCVCVSLQSMEKGKDQKWIQSSTTSDPGDIIRENDKNTREAKRSVRKLERRKVEKTTHTKSGSKAESKKGCHIKLKNKRILEPSLEYNQQPRQPFGGAEVYILCVKPSIDDEQHSLFKTYASYSHVHHCCI